MHEFRIGAVLGDTFKVIFGNILPFGTMALVIYGIIGVVNASFVLDMASGVAVGENISENAGTFIALTVISILFGFFLSAMITYGTYQDLRGRKAGFGACMGRGVALVLPVIGASILTILIAFFFSLLLVIPGIIAIIILYVVVPVVVVERPGAFASLGRSRTLTKGHRWKVFGIFLVLIVLSAIVSVILQFVSLSVGLVAGIAIGVIGQSIGGVLMAVGPAVTYYHLRRAKEGIDIEQIAAVFD